MLVAQPLLRDADLRTDEFFFSAPVSKGSYLWGRAPAARLQRSASTRSSRSS